jgi:hypothetical protein
MFESRTKDEVRLCFWPSPQDYNEAVQNLSLNVPDDELSQGLVYLDALGLPRPITGSFASVYRLKCDARDVALRCFLHNIADQQERYARISRFVQHDSLPYTVMFDFLQRGVRVGGSWFPALKMEWVEGEPLDRYIAHQLAQPERLERLAREFLKMMEELQAAGIAHGDLQHGNILVLETGELRLVDYDGMYVPDMPTLKANELGHRNYQHPKRNAEHFGPYIDNFSAWVIYASIVGLHVDPKLWHQLAAGDDCLLFRQSDFQDPVHSPAFAAMEQHSESSLQLLGRFLRAQVKTAPDVVPFLNSPTPTVKGISPLSNTSPIRNGPRVIHPSVPEWMTEENIDLLSSTGKSDTKVNHYMSPPPVAWANPAAPQPPAGLSGAFAVAGATLEPELLQPTPRKVVVNSKHPLPSPKVFQFLMLLNPFVWGAVCFLMLVGPDSNLMRNGRDYAATVENSRPYTVNSKYGPQSFQHIEYRYVVNGKEYIGDADGIRPGNPDANVGATFTIHALPSDPTSTEPVFQRAGTRCIQDLGGFTLCFLISMAFELWIWLPALRQKKLVVQGNAVPAEVTDKNVYAGAKGEAYYHIRVQFFTTTGSSFPALFSVNAQDYARYKVGDVVTLLYDPDNPCSSVIYQRCRYRAARLRPRAP